MLGKKSEPPEQIKPMTFQILVGRSNHWATGDTHGNPQYTGGVCLAQWLEHPTSIWKVMGLISTRDLDLFPSIS